MQYLADISLFEALNTQGSSVMMNSNAVYNANTIHKGFDRFKKTRSSIRNVDWNADTTYSITPGDEQTTYGYEQPTPSTGNVEQTTYGYNQPTPSTGNVEQTTYGYNQPTPNTNTNVAQNKLNMAQALPSPIENWITAFRRTALQKTRAYFEDLWQLKRGVNEDTNQAWADNRVAINAIWDQTVVPVAQKFIKTFNTYWKFVQNTYAAAYNTNRT